MSPMHSCTHALVRSCTRALMDAAPLRVFQKKVGAGAVTVAGGEDGGGREVAVRVGVVVLGPGGPDFIARERVAVTCEPSPAGDLFSRPGLP